MKSIIIYILIIITIFSSLILYIYIDDTNVGITNYLVRSDKIPENFNKYKIAFISDFHSSDNFEMIIKQTEKIKPEVILLGGDILDMRAQNYYNSLDLLLGLKKICPIYLVKGNHENFNKNYYQEFLKDLVNLKIPILSNETVSIKKGNNDIILTGMTDPYLQDNEIENSKFIENFKKYSKSKIDNNKYNILLMHRANIFPLIADLNYDLVLSGHLHGGLVRFPILGGLFSPDLESAPIYSSGVYDLNSSKMIVNRGCDKNFNRPRVFNGPEILSIELISTK